MSNNPREIAPPHSRPLTKTRLRCSYASAIAPGTQHGDIGGYDRRSVTLSPTIILTLAR